MRLFLAVDIPEKQKRSIEKALQKLRSCFPDARWIPRANWHATLKFLGEVPDERLGQVEAAVRSSTLGSQPIDSHLTDVGAFPSSRRARVIWVGLEDSAGALVSLAGRLDASLSSVGFRGESRPLHPHITVARIKVPLDVETILDEAGPYSFDRSPFPLDRVTLYWSRLGRSGAQYEPLAVF